MENVNENVNENEKIKYSVITIMSDGLIDTVACLSSVIQNSKNFELIVVDNLSTDGSSGYIEELAAKHSFIKVLQQKEKKCFSANNNDGLQLVDPESEYVVFLNNDTIVYPGWLERMEAHFHNVPMPNVGAVGPVSSMSNGRQMVGKQNGWTWYDQHKGAWLHVGILFGWCIMIKQEIFNEIGVFDETLENSHEDNDLSLRIQLAGYNLIVAQDVYIDHKGQGTLSRQMTMEEYIANGYEMRERYHDKYWIPSPKKLVAVYRTNAGVHLEESLEQTSKFADHIIIHFCRAPKIINFKITDQSNMEYTREEYEQYLHIKFPKIKIIGWYDGVFQEDYERGWLLEKALELHDQGDADWCISIDDDEIYEDKFIEMSKKLMNPRNPEILGYWTNWFTIWRKELGKEYYRTDSTFGQFTNYRFFKLIPGQRILSFHPEGHHCGSAPYIAEENLRHTNIRVKHLGYDSPEQRQRKYEFYTKNDNFKNKKDIGFDDYSHLIDMNVKVDEYIENNGISLVMMVKDEEEYLLQCLEHVQHIVDELIIVDTGSTDRTIDIIKKFKEHTHIDVKLFHYPWCHNYSIPRNYGKQFATQRWILHLDADENFSFQNVLQLFKLTQNNRVLVYVFHVLNYLEKQKISGVVPKYASTESIRLYRNIPELYYTGVIHETLDDALAAYSFKGKVSAEQPNFPLHHYGYLKERKVVANKLEYYETLNNNQIYITEKKDPRPYYNLAMHYLQDDKLHEALKAFQTALKINPRFWNAAQQMAALNMNNAKAFLKQTVETIRSNHPFKAKAIEVLNYLEQNSFGFIKTAKKEN